MARAVVYLQKHKIATLEQLNIVLSGMKQKANQASTGMQKAEKRMKDIAGIQSAIAVYQEQKAVHDKYLKIGWKKTGCLCQESSGGAESLQQSLPLFEVGLLFINNDIRPFAEDNLSENTKCYKLFTTKSREKEHDKSEEKCYTENRGEYHNGKEKCRK